MTNENVSLPQAKNNLEGKLHNAILGWATPQEINQCVADKVITYRQGTYCIPMELKLVTVGRSVSKEWVVSNKYIQYMIKTGRMKNVNN